MTTIPPSAKGRQVRRYYALLERLGFNQVFNQIAEASTTPVPTGPTRPGEMQTAATSAGTAGDVRVQIDLGTILRACAGADGAPNGLTALDELAAAVLDLTDEEAAAGEWTAAEVEAGYGPFSDASAGLLALLMSPRFGPA